MNEQDCLTVYHQLLHLLKDLNLGWVAEQILDIVSAGKTIEETVSGRKTPDLKLGYYSPREQLLLLISAVNQVIVNTVEFESDIQRLLSHEASISIIKPELCFTSSFEPEGKPIKLTSDSLQIRQHHAEKLKVLLDKLQKEVIQNAD